MAESKNGTESKGRGWFLLLLIPVIAFGAWSIFASYQWVAAAWDAHRLSDLATAERYQSGLYLEALREMVKYHCDIDDNDPTESWSMRIPLGDNIFHFSCNGEERTFELQSQ